MAFCGGWIVDVFNDDFKFHLISEALTFVQYKDSIDWIHRELLELAAAEIVIPLPPVIEIKG